MWRIRDQEVAQDVILLLGSHAGLIREILRSFQCAPDLAALLNFKRRNRLLRSYQQGSSSFAK